MSSQLQRERKAIESIREAIRIEPRNLGRQAAGAVTVGWYRGRHEGWYESYKELRGKFPEAAKYLLEQFGMNKDGVLAPIEEE